MLATIALVALGYLQLRWTQHRPVSVRVLGASLVALLAGVSAALPALLSAMLVRWALAALSRPLAVARTKLEVPALPLTGGSDGRAALSHPDPLLVGRLAERRGAATPAARG
jgi:hypothetical protein